MRPSPRLLLAALAGAAFVVLVSWATVSGPVGVPHHAGGRAQPRAERTDEPLFPQRSLGAQPVLTPKAHHSPRFHIGPWLPGGIVLALVVALFVRTAPRLVRALRERFPGGTVRTPRPEAPALLSTQEVAQAVAGDLANQLAVLEEGTPRNGVVAAWSRLEQVATASGAAPEPWETSAEFTVRLLHRLDVDPRSAGRLAELYRAARFSSHELGEAERAAAREALTTLSAELSAA